jgi:hypothetical protein
MKKLLLGISTSLLFISCGNDHLPDGVKHGFGVQTVTQDECEYILYKKPQGVALVHKQNCSFCINRLKP